jgi:hypothetical protein
MQSSFSEQYIKTMQLCNDKQYQNAYALLKTSKKLIKTIDEKKKYTNLLLQLLISLNYKQELTKICNKIIFSNDYDWHLQNECIHILSQCCPCLTANTFFNIKLDCPTLQNYHISSASIIKQDDIYVCNLRAVNYIYTKEGDYVSRDEDRIVRTKNYIVNLDQQWLIQNMVELQECDDVTIYPCHILGMEDVRLFGPCYYFCTRLDVTANHKPKIGFGCYDNQGETTKMIILGDDDKTEKNWLPIYKGDSCHIIYSFYPLIINNLDCETGLITSLVHRYIDGNNLSTFRGSAVPIQYKDGWLCTVHQVYYNKKRIYLHRFVWLSDDYLTVKYSQAFYFEKIGVEFNLGIALYQEGLIVTYSVDDANSTLCIISYDDVNSMLQL